MKIKIFVFIIIIFTYTNLYAELTKGKWEIVFNLDVKVNGYGTQCYLHSIASADKKNIIAAANINGETPYFIKSQDSGKTWKITHAEEVQGPKSLYSNALTVPAPNLAIVVCDSGSYWRSTDNGETWVQHFMENRKRIWQVDFWDNKTGIIFQSRTGENQEIQKTTEGGLTWFQISGPEPVHETAVSYLFTKGNGIAYCIEVDNKIDSVYYFHKSTDYGETWQEPYKGPAVPPFGNFYFYNENLGFCFGDYGMAYQLEGKLIRRTSDGGRTWEEVLKTNVNNNPITDIHFSDSLNGIAASITNIYRTFDGGKNWVPDTNYDYHTNPTRISLVYLIDKNNAIGLATNSDHKVMRFTAEPATYVVDGYEVSRFDIYPNPAVSYLNLDLPEGFDESSEYSIYTIDGKEMKSGSISKKIDIAELNIGVYYLIISKDKKIHYSKFVKE